MAQSIISVIIPIYNVEKYLFRCINSIVNQTYRELEIILVDDGSLDNCPQMCDEWAVKDKRIKVVHKENGGLSDARNVGLDSATGEYISFIDSDDWINLNTFEKMISRMKEDKSDIVTCGVNWVKDEKIIRKDTSNDVLLNNHLAMYELLNDRAIKQYVWNKLYKREIVQNVPFEKGRYHEDVFWTYKIIGKAKWISIMSDSFYNYMQRSNSIMGESYSANRLDALDAMQLRCEYIFDNYPDLYDNALYTYIGSCHYHLQCALRTHQSSDVINNIKYRFIYRKNGHPTRNISLKQKIWFFLFTCFPITTCKFRNMLGVGL